MTLAQHLAQRHNGLTTARFILAVLVVYGHAYELGGFGSDPLQRATGITFGEIAVNAFFAISGYLVAGSWLRSASAFDYLKKRCLRIFPGLWICLIVVGLGLLPWLAAHLRGGSWLDRTGDSHYLGYVWKNALLKVGQSQVDGLFSTQPAAGVINGSLWSLFPEFLYYLGLAAIGIIGLLHKSRLRWLVGLALALYLVQAVAPLVWPGLKAGGYGRAWWLWRFGTQAAYFAGGVVLHACADRVPVRGRWIAATFAALAAAAFLGVYSWFAPLLLPVFVLSATQVLPEFLRREPGDYSYGIYIYHYPLQQTLYALKFTSGHASGFFLAALLLTLPVAALSWHFIEKPALRLKTHLPRTS